MHTKEKALIAMSGGVDSAVAAALMVEAGYECMGVTMKLYSNEEDEKEGVCYDKTCCSLEDVEDARGVASRLGIPYHVFNMMNDFEEQVIDRFVSAYECGLTPNPCIDCNRYMKFDKLFLRAKALGYDKVVTGHYASVEYDEKSDRYLLCKGVDETKDQSYVLYSMTQEQLSHTIFPLGKYRKSEIRQMALDRDFVNAKKRESQDICFVPDGNYTGFIRKYTGKEYEKGLFRNTKGDVLGTHEGMIRYTIGQRKGLGLSLPEPLYVCDKDLDKNEVILGTNSQLMSTKLRAKDFNWIFQKPNDSMEVMAKVRYSQKEQAATVYPLGENQMELVFHEPVRAITKGQAVVLYQGDYVVGGGTISEVFMDA